METISQSDRTWIAFSCWLWHAITNVFIHLPKIASVYASNETGAINGVNLKHISASTFQAYIGTK